MRRQSIIKLLTATGMAIASSPAMGLEAGAPGYADPRIKTYVFDPAQVFRITAHFGFVTTIQFGKGEIVDSVQLGDSVSWQVDRLKRGDMLSVVPIERVNPFTNMLVTTNKRIYSFDLTARDAPYAIEDASVTFLYRFDFPKTWAEFEAEHNTASTTIRSFDDVEIKSADKAIINRQYRASGPDYLKPIAMIDDGEKTYLRFNAGTPRPAIFALGKDRTETVLNHSTLPDGTLVVHGVRARLTLRGPGGVICIYNDARIEESRPWILDGAAAQDHSFPNDKDTYDR